MILEHALQLLKTCHWGSDDCAMWQRLFQECTAGYAIALNLAMSAAGDQAATMRIERFNNARAVARLTKK